MKPTQEQVKEVYEKLEKFKAEIIRDYGLIIVPSIMPYFDVALANEESKKKAMEILGADLGKIIKVDNTK